MIVNETKQILAKYNVHVKKAYGQNFLIKEHVMNEIIEYSGISDQTCVIEIGPGLGGLTEYLAKKAKKVLCYEIDKQMVEILNDTLSAYDNIIVENKDFLKVDLQKDIKLFLGDCIDIRVVANLPYYITTPIIFKLLESSTIENFIFMIQKEVGARLTGRPNTKDYNALSVLMEYKTKSRIVANVSRKCFYPEPNVDSVLIQIKTIKSDYGVINEPRFLDFVQAIFMQRRKTILNNVSSYYKIDKKMIEDIISKQGLDINVRAEALNIKEIADLYIALFE
jgi:16S rRNA (adenine1518-N6/adenine1519-N6)-dimethyltransferase